MRRAARRRRRTRRRLGAEPSRGTAIRIYQDSRRPRANDVRLGREHLAGPRRPSRRICSRPVAMSNSVDETARGPLPGIEQMRAVEIASCSPEASAALAPARGHFVPPMAF